MIRKLLYLCTDNTDPYHNLALEQYLTDTVPADTCILYLWQNRHTVVIGRNQNAWQECRTALLEQDGGKLSRRLSGGGAVYHDMGNLNFTFSLPTAEYDLHRQQRVIVEACRSLGIEASFSGRNDILAAGRKFSGNSFYHHNGCSFHNGTLLVSVDMANLGKYLTPSQRKLQSKGVASVPSRVVNLSELHPGLRISQMQQAMAQALSAPGRSTKRRIRPSNSTSIPSTAATANTPPEHQTWRGKEAPRPSGRGRPRNGASAIHSRGRESRATRAARSRSSPSPFP